jgi:hypothetical protein
MGRFADRESRGAGGAVVNPCLPWSAGSGACGPGEAWTECRLHGLGQPVRVQRDHPYPSTAAATRRLAGKGIDALQLAMPR